MKRLKKLFSPDVLTGLVYTDSIYAKQEGVTGIVQYLRVGGWGTLMWSYEQRRISFVKFVWKSKLIKWWKG